MTTTLWLRPTFFGVYLSCVKMSMHFLHYNRQSAFDLRRVLYHRWPLPTMKLNLTTGYKEYIMRNARENGVGVEWGPVWPNFGFYPTERTRYLYNRFKLYYNAFAVGVPSRSQLGEYRLHCWIWRSAVSAREEYKKLRYREEHSVSVVLSWRTGRHFSGENVLMANYILVITPKLPNSEK